MAAMASPYRSAPTTAKAVGPRDSGIVGEIVGQFADKLAFYRELVQNAIDADTEAIEVEIRYEGAAQALRVSVTDYGCGMSQEVIENQLLVLFRSTKEGDDKRIGKFGIGFVSVLALSPSLVKVVSCCEGTRHTLHLYPDLSYELFESGRCTVNSTKVELEIPMPPDNVEDFVKASVVALRRWCRHATPHISFLAFGADGKQLQSERIDSELALPGALASVEIQSTDGRRSAFVGITRTPYCAFFNHGLLLYETQAPLLGGVSFVIQDANLGHTLSRDNVRQDKHYENALSVLEDAVKKLNPQVTSALYSYLDQGDFVNYRDLLIAAEASLDSDTEDWPVHLCHALKSGERLTMREFFKGEQFVAVIRSPVTAALSEAGVAVADLTALSGDERSNSWFLNTCGKLRYPNEELTLVVPVECSTADLLLLDRVLVLCELVTREPSEILFAELEGVDNTRLTIAGNLDQSSYDTGAKGTWLLDAKDASRDPFRLLARPALVLNVKRAEVAAARRLAASDSLAAADILVRAILIDHEKMNVEVSEKLARVAMQEILGSVQ